MHVGAGAHVRLVDLGDEIRLRQVQLVERPVQEDPLRVQHRPHRAVADEHAPVQLFEKRGPEHVITSIDSNMVLQRPGVDRGDRTSRRDPGRPIARPARSLSVNRWWWPNRCRRGFIAARTSLIGVLPASLPRPTTIRPRGLVRQEDVHVAHRLAGLDLFPHEMPPLVGQLRSPSRSPSSDAAAPLAGVSYQVGASVPPRPATRSAGPSISVSDGVGNVSGGRPADRRTRSRRSSRCCP